MSKNIILNKKLAGKETSEETIYVEIQIEDKEAQENWELVSEVAEEEEETMGIDILMKNKIMIIEEEQIVKDLDIQKMIMLKREIKDKDSKMMMLLKKEIKEEEEEVE